MVLRSYLFKRLIVLLLLFLPLISFPVTAAALCGSDPLLPPEGLVWPASGEIAGEWSLDCGNDHGHRGIDIAAAPGEEILAAASGRVTFVGYTPAEGGGVTITIDHDGGLRSTYLHLGVASVTTGDAVSQGQAIGTSDGRPLHFGLKLADGDGVYFNPLSYLPVPEEAASEELVETSSSAAGGSQPLPVPPAESVSPLSGEAETPTPEPSTAQASGNPLPVASPEPVIGSSPNALMIPDTGANWQPAAEDNSIANHSDIVPDAEAVGESLADPIIEITPAEPRAATRDAQEPALETSAEIGPIPNDVEAGHWLEPEFGVHFSAAGAGFATADKPGREEATNPEVESPSIDLAHVSPLAWEGSGITARSTAANTVDNTPTGIVKEPVKTVSTALAIIVCALAFYLTSSKLSLPQLSQRPKVVAGNC